MTALLGEGGMGAVYAAVHVSLPRKAAIKVLRPQLAADPDIRTRFFNEARAANAIGHPGIVDVFDFGTLASGASYLAMELLEGETLAARLRRVRRVPLGDAVAYGAEAAAALSAAHARGIVHRDLKPDNIFLVGSSGASRGRVKILDFGIAKLMAAGEAGDSAGTKTGALLGTPVYMSPEQCRGIKNVDHRADIYALGVILYELATGSPPFMAEGAGDLVHMHISVAPVPPRVRNPGIPVPLEAVIVRALAKDPARRFANMDAFAAALGGAPAATIAGAAIDPAMPTVLAPGTEPPQAATVPDNNNTTLSGGANSSASVPTVKRSRGLSLGLVAGLVVAALAVVGAVAFPKFRGSAENAAVPPTKGEVPPRPSPTVGAPAAEIDVRIASEPAGARITRVADEALLGVTPLEQTWPRRAGATKLRLELAGHEPALITVALDVGTSLRVALKPLPPKPAAARRRQSGGDAIGAPQPTAAPRPTPAATKTVEPVEL